MSDDAARLQTALRTLGELLDLVRRMVKAHDEGNAEPVMREAKDLLEMYDSLHTRPRQ